MERLVTVKQAALMLSLSPEFLKKLRRQGGLRVVRLGRAVRISERELERLAVEGVRPLGEQGTMSSRQDRRTIEKKAGSPRRAADLLTTPTQQALVRETPAKA